MITHSRFPFLSPSTCGCATLFWFLSLSICTSAFAFVSMRFALHSECGPFLYLTYNCRLTVLCSLFLRVDANKVKCFLARFPPLSFGRQSNTRTSSFRLAILTICRWIPSANFPQSKLAASVHSAQYLIATSGRSLLRRVHCQKREFAPV